MTLGMADAHKKPVHQLRTTTRRIEAQLHLLDHLGQLPADVEAVVEARKVLRRIRRAAGAVRDLDVQREVLDAYGSREPDATAGSAEHDAKAMRRMARDAGALNAVLERRRERDGAELVRLLERKRRRLAPALEALLGAMAANEDMALSPARLEEETRAWYAGQAGLRGARGRTADALHATRKVAKMARYLAESAGTRELAGGFERLQKSGGTWHDLLTLWETAKGELGRRSELRGRLKRDTREAREAYRGILREFRER